MSCMTNVKEVCGGLGKIDLSREAVPAFDKSRPCSSISRAAICALVAIMAIASIIVGCICCASGGTALACGVLSIALALLGLSWAAIVLKHMFCKQVVNENTPIELHAEELHAENAPVELRAE
ncbi:hypothetical protein [Chlamydia caviae]|uniref:Conserved domain protein n=1 Tax=Chlamydia caviae (strain ATCC VR-813 / DSM 19441 / 03DC25 / GPIC) TaxID=227941 RepID=Q822Q9_CHLCV|nr:hypothetical protein [Chlamydia caviae]AAP05362.1 conserved domain protein [Chlamydia caviae GPIC]